ncbi:MAG: YggT family protein [Actinomycetia bacterium]|nr:YggT family protein [Actinomycetes bacterium]MCP4223970.1 YggT family protein [Actinomycetes bacterium]MCP5031258.1 YggT family protein [Actinomycetes bacterium]
MSGILLLLLYLVMIVFIVRAIISWFPIGFDSPFRPVVDTLYRITDPVLAPIRRVLPPMGGLDLSVLIVIIVIRFVLIPIASNL